MKVSIKVLVSSCSLVDQSRHSTNETHRYYEVPLRREACVTFAARS